MSDPHDPGVSTARPQPDGAGRAGDVRSASERPPEQRSTTELLSDLSQQTARLVRTEARLAARELTGKVRRTARGGGLVGLAGTLGLYAGGALVASAIMLLSTVLAAWIAALVVAGGLLVLAGPLALIGGAQLRKATPPVPESTLNNLREDVDTVREKARL